MTVPVQTLIEVTSKCNLRCKGCPINAQTNAGQHMEYDLFTSIVDRIIFPTTVVPWVNGEPLLHPRYYDMIRYITDRNLRSYITTNGHYWNEDLFQHLTDGTSVYQIIFSLDGLPHEFSKSIEVARPGSNRKKAIDTINRFMEMNDSKGNKIDVAVKICRRGQDYEEIEEYIGYWLRRGVSYVCVGGMLDTINDSSMRIYPCRYPDNLFMVIRADGMVVACAYHPEVHNNDYFRIGNVNNDTPLLEVYNNEVLTELREDQKKGIFHGPCKTCGFAYTGDGFDGVIRSRNEPRLRLGDIYYHSDYYNQFFSLIKKRKTNQYYQYYAWSEIKGRLHVE